MKVFICAVTALIVLTAGIIRFCFDVDNLCSSLLSDADLLEGMILNEKSETSERLISDMLEKWTAHTPLFMAFSEHNDINSVTDCLTDMKNRLFFGDFKSAYYSLSDFKRKVSYISADSKPTLINIF